MSRCVEKLPHSCGSGDGLQVFEQEDGGYDGFCFACGTYVPDPYGDKPEGYKPAVKPAKTEAEVQADLDEIATYASITLPDRKLRKESLSHFGVKVAVSEQDGETPVAVYFPYERGATTTGYKARLLGEKRMWCIGSVRGAELFGWQQALASGGKRLLVTEGEFDCVALYQALKDKSAGTKWADLEPAVVSVGTGSGGAKDYISTHLSEINRHFKEVVLVFDNDEPGHKAVEEVLKVLPHAMTAYSPYGKDANEAVIKGYSKALADVVLWKAAVPKNTRLVRGATLHEAGRKQAEMGFSYPWPGLTKLLRGLRLGETSYWGAGVKMGKSELVNALSAHCVKEHGWKVFLAKPEEANRKSYQMMLGKLSGKIFHDPDKPFDFEAYDEASKKYGDQIFFLDLYQHMGWQELKADIRVAVQEGCKFVVIDPITNLVNGESSGEQNTMLQEIAQELAAMAKDLNIHIAIFCHLKAPLNGESHERGGKVFSHQFAGSRAMMRSCNLMFGLEGNKDPDLDEEKRNMRRLVILEDREFGATGFITLYWDKHTGLFNECK